MSDIGKPRVAQILLVEDNPADVRMIDIALRAIDFPHVLHVVDNGENALAFLRQDEPYAKAPRADMVLLDLALPRLNGHRVLEEIDKDARLRNVPVVVLSGSKRDTDVDRAYGLGVNAYIIKPVGLRAYIDEMNIVRQLVAI